MNVYEIINKPVITQDECKFVVEQYIKEMKLVDVNINIDRSKGYYGVLEELRLLEKAYVVAHCYFMEKLNK